VINEIPMQGKQNMSQENGHHHHDQAPHPDKAAAGNVLKDPACEMDVGKDSPHHIEHGEGKIYFCLCTSS
jgi:hypothetical protein